MGENLEVQSMLLLFVNSGRIPHWASIGKATRTQEVARTDSQPFDSS